MRTRPRCIATARGGIGADLDGVRRRKGGPRPRATLFRRGWDTVKDLLSGHKDQAVLDECERAEDVALGQYRKALKQELPSAVRQVVEQQMLGVQSNQDRIKALRNELKARA